MRANASIGFQSLHEPATFSRNDWIHAIRALRVAAALYWTEHVRAAVEATSIPKERNTGSTR